MNKKKEVIYEKELFRWYEAYFSSLFNYGIQITSNKELIKDCIQEIFIHLKLNYQLVADIRKPKVYLYTSLRNKIIQELKKENRLISVDLINGNFEIELPFESELISQQTLIEYQAQLTKSLNKLTFRQKEAIFLKFYEELSYQEVAQTMQLQDVKSARNLVYKAINELKKDFKLSGISILATTIFLLLSL